MKNNKFYYRNTVILSPIGNILTEKQLNYFGGGGGVERNLCSQSVNNLVNIRNPSTFKLLLISSSVASVN